MRVLENSSANQFLRELSHQYDEPKGIVIISAHWESSGLQLSTQSPLDTIHDFWGFPPELHKVIYPANSAQWLQESLHQAIEKGGFNVSRVDRGLDHGAWSILKLMYPNSAVPIVALSLPADKNLSEIYELGQALGKLREQGIMIIGSGSATHNLSALAHGGSPSHWALAFVDWLQDKVANNNLDELLDYRQLAQGGTMSHPLDEHLRPLFIAMGAGQGSPAELIHDSWELKNINNSSWAWM